MVITKDLVMEKLIELLNEVHVENKDLGEQMLISACFKYFMSPERYEPKKIYTVLYDEIAESFGRTNSCVEKSIRAVLDSAWALGNPTSLYGLYGEAVPSGKTRATAKRFIKQTAMLLNQRIK